MSKKNLTKKSFSVKDGDFRKASSTLRNFSKDFCVEVAIKPEGVAVRDSKNRTRGTLFFINGEWAAFVKGAMDGEFDPIGGVEQNLP